ncbi:hypothetical protein ACFV3E_40750 [Streptomyces sp. NPDC059718]
MPVFLEPPAPQPGGPDGRGWNRLSLNAHMASPSPQCALRPRTLPTLWESQDTRRARWGNFGPCVKGRRACDDACPVWAALRQPAERMPFHAARVLVRMVTEQDPDPAAAFNATVRTQLYVTDRPESPAWRTTAPEWSFESITRVRGWEIGRRHVDEHGEGFWLHRTPAEPAAHAQVGTRAYRSMTRHVVTIPGGRAVLLTCTGECRHDEVMLNAVSQATPDRTDDGRVPFSLWDPVILPEVTDGRHLGIAHGHSNVTLTLAPARNHAAPYVQAILSGSAWTRERITEAASALVRHTTA